jgi:hypothetical protein
MSKFMQEVCLHYRNRAEPVYGIPSKNRQTIGVLKSMGRDRYPVYL